MVAKNLPFSISHVYLVQQAKKTNKKKYENIICNEDITVIDNIRLGSLYNMRCQTELAVV